MTRADTAERTNILHWKGILILQVDPQLFYGTGYMLVILFRSNITVDDLHHGTILVDLSTSNQLFSLSVVYLVL